MIHYITTNGVGNPWVAAEMEIVQKQGVPCALCTMRSPGTHYFKSEWVRRLDAECEVLYPLPKARFAADVLAAPLRFGGRFAAALWNALTGERESLRARVAGLAHLFVAAHWAARLRRGGREVSLIHSQWIHSCGTIGMYAAWLMGVPFSFTGHAVDLFRDRVALKDKVRRAEFIVAISSFHRDLYLSLGADPAKIITVFCGIDVGALAFRPRPMGGETPVVLSLGRLIEKKGFEYLIDACAILRDRGVALRCIIGGDGPLEGALKRRIAERGLEGVVQLDGKAVLQEDLPRFFAQGHVFAQPCVWAADGDVDGTPRTLMEAMACGNAAISTRLVGIPDIVEDGVSGLLVEPRDAAALANAMERLVTDPAQTARFAAEGRERMERLFQIDRCVEGLVTQFRARLRGACGEGGAVGTGVARATPTGVPA